MGNTADDPQPGRPPMRPTAAKWLAVGLLWMVALLNYLDRLTITTIRVPLKAEIAMTDAQFGLLTSVFLWVYGAFSPLGGYVADRFSRRGVIILSLFIWSGVTWLTGHLHTFDHLLLARAAMGISEACYIPAALALISDYHRGRTRSLATGIHMSGIYAGAALGGLGGVIAEHFGWRSAFGLLGGVGVAYSIVIILCLRDAPESTSDDRVTPEASRRSLAAALRELAGSRAFAVLLVIDGLVGVANWGIYGWLPTYLQEQFRLGLGTAGMTATAYIQVASFAGVLAGGWVADRWSRTQPDARARVPAIGFCVVAPLLYLAATTHTLPVAIAGLLAFGLGRGFFDANLMPIVRSVIDERFSATAYGLLNLVSVFLGGAMVYVGGSLQDARVGLNRVFQVSAVGLLAVGLLLFAIRRRPGLRSAAGLGQNEPASP
ncbi:MAG TPA: MFS transporter [Opitutaceae bacterium]|nr:MFS transporter [Opitutaceae bacterium]